MLKTTRPATVPQISPEYRSAPAFFIDPEGIAMIWRRDMVRLWRQRSRLLGAVARALVWLFALGFGLRGSLGSIAGFNYEQFVFPGVIAMTVIFSGLQSAISIVYDREFGFLKEVQVAPTPRSTLVIGKCLGGASSSTVQALIILVFAPFASVALNPLNVLATVVEPLSLPWRSRALAWSLRCGSPTLRTSAPSRTLLPCRSTCSREQSSRRAWFRRGCTLFSCSIR